MHAAQYSLSLHTHLWSQTSCPADRARPPAASHRAKHRHTATAATAAATISKAPHRVQSRPARTTPRCHGKKQGVMAVAGRQRDATACVTARRLQRQAGGPGSEIHEGGQAGAGSHPRIQEGAVALAAVGGCDGLAEAGQPAGALGLVQDAQEDDACTRVW